MTAPLQGHPVLAGQFAEPHLQTTGMYAGPRGEVLPRGALNPPQDTTVYAGSSGIFWDQMPAVISGATNYAGVSTITGVPMGTPEDAESGKVGGGAAKAQIPDYGGTAAY